MTTLLGGLWVLSGLYLLVCLVFSWRAMPRLPQAVPSRRKWPLISICVPARNEEKRLAPLLTSLSRLDYPRYEVLVLDDESGDNTAGLVREFAGRSSRIRLLKGKPLPSGWRGKTWACHRLSLQARGEWILFVDADTWFGPEILKRCLQAAERSRADVLSLIPHEVVGTWLERLVIPTLVFCLTGFVPMRLALRRGSPLYRYMGVNGQFAFFRADAYRSFGGHRSVAHEIVDDIQIGRAAVRAGLQLSFFNGTDEAACRMYTNAREVREGFAKNMMPFFRFGVAWTTLGLGFLFLVGVAPFIALAMGSAAGVLFLPALLLVLAQWAVRLDQARQYRMPALSALLHPFGCLAFGLIGLNSIYWYAVKKKGWWRGRELRIGAGGKHA